jgi:hypothetical protein
MGLNRLAENRIREAMREGKLDTPPGRGPIDLEDYFKVPEDMRMAYSVLKSAGCVPEEVELLREVDRLETSLARAQDEGDRGPLRRDLAAARLKLELALERRRRQRNADASAP